MRLLGVSSHVCSRASRTLKCNEGTSKSVEWPLYGVLSILILLTAALLGPLLLSFPVTPFPEATWSAFKPPFLHPAASQASRTTSRSTLLFSLLLGAQHIFAFRFVCLLASLFQQFCPQAHQSDIGAPSNIHVREAWEHPVTSRPRADPFDTYVYSDRHLADPL